MNCAELFPLDDRAFEERTEPQKLFVSVSFNPSVLEGGDKVKDDTLRNFGILSYKSEKIDDLTRNYIYIRDQQEDIEWPAKRLLSLKLYQDDGYNYSGIQKAEMLARLLLGFVIKRPHQFVGQVLWAFLNNRESLEKQLEEVQKLHSRYATFLNENGNNPCVKIGCKVAKQLVQWSTEHWNEFLSEIEPIDEGLDTIFKNVDILEQAVEAKDSLDNCKRWIYDIRNELKAYREQLIELGLNGREVQEAINERKVKIQELYARLSAMLQTIRGNEELSKVR